MWGNPLQHSGCLLQLVELIPRRPKYIYIYKISVGEPLAKFQLLSLVAPPLLDCLRRPIVAKTLGGGTPCKILVVIFSCALIFRLPKEDKSGGTPYKIIVACFSYWN